MFTTPLRFPIWLPERSTKAPNGDALDTKIDKYIGSDGKTLTVYADYVDKDGVRWCVLGHGDGDKWDWQDWVKLKTTVTGGIVADTSGLEMDVTVTVTNSYVNSRVNATIFSAQNGSYSKATNSALSILQMPMASFGAKWRPAQRMPLLWAGLR